LKNLGVVSIQRFGCINLKDLKLKYHKSKNTCPVISASEIKFVFHSIAQLEKHSLESVE
jgi:hypothetical protein